MPKSLEEVVAYHDGTKHQPWAMARGPGGLDWANQPHPFRVYEGAVQIRLNRKGFTDAKKSAGERAEYVISAASSLNKENLSQLFFESLALSGQKSFAGTRWSLRVNPSSGNLHPTEGYLLAGDVADLLPGVYHYAPKSHSLELLARIERESWQSLGLPEETLLMAFTSIYWRESWKYGERAFRYCMLDVGHALAAVAIAGHVLGWQAALLDDTGSDELSSLLGLDGEIRFARENPEREHADAIVALFCDGKMHHLSNGTLDLSSLDIKMQPVNPNILSSQHVPWDAIDRISEATKKPPTHGVYGGRISSPSSGLSDEGIDLISRYSSILQRRRSAQAMDGRCSMPVDSFSSILRATLPNAPPFGLLPWRPCVHPVIFLHRVEGLERGLYILLRDAGQKEDLQEAMHEDFLWERLSRTTGDLPLYLLVQGDSSTAAKEASCRQDIASDGCFAAAMIARFEEPLQEFGPWFYSRLHWECGMIGQTLYLAAEAAGFQGCGIGCFFDDMVARMLRLSGRRLQDMYHFTIGRAVPDPRLIDLPAYD